MEKLRSLSTRELKDLLKDRGLSQSCRIKEDLVQRLYEAQFAESAGKVDSEEDYIDASSEKRDCGLSETGSELEEEEIFGQGSTGEAGISSGAQLKGVTEKQVTRLSNIFCEGKDLESSPGAIKLLDMAQNNFVFKDVEESLESFSGESGKDVSTWLKEFEDIAAVCSWGDVQKYLYARRLLSGAAKLAVEASVGLHSWKSLKNYLENEFGSNLPSISVHRALEKRKKNQNETYLEYLYSMKHIASRGKVDDKSLIVYIIEGIPDETSNKIILYEASTLAELKDKLHVYETIRSQRKKADNSSAGHRRGKGEDNKSRCVNCGATSHPNWRCPHRAKGSRCFKCNEFGHIAPNCPQKAGKGESTHQNRVNLIAVPDLHVNVLVQGQEIKGLVDTGSDVSLIRKSLTQRIKIPKDQKGPGIFLTGFGQNLKKTNGSFISEVQIQNETYSIKFHIVPDMWISQDILLGKDLIEDARIIFEKEEVKIERLRKKKNKSVENFLEVMEIEKIVENETRDPLEGTVSEKGQEKVKSLIESYSPQKPKKSCIEMKICLENETPIYQKPRRLAPREKEVVAQQIREWLEEGIIRNSNSDFASPIVLVTKKDNTYRLCVDYRKLNQKIIRDRYPLPVIEDILESLYDANFFTTLDLRNGFFHVDISEESRKYTSFVTPDGQYEFLKAPFGLCNSPSVFQRFINCIFQPLVQKGTLLVYLDDIIIPSRTESENVEKLDETLKVAEQHGLSIKWKKCKFLKRTIEFLGHIVEGGTIKPSKEKVLAVKNFPRPQNIKQVQSFLGLTGFFRKFVPHYSSIAKPISDLLKKDSEFSFGIQQEDAFNQLKDILCSDPVLKLFNPAAETELHTDASRIGYGAVLLQRNDEDNKFHPIFYLSFKTSKVEQNYSSYELEVLAIVKSLKKLRTYLLGLKFKIYTDCKAFHLTMKKKELSSRVARWALILEEYDCTVLHKSGTAMRHVDALSRYPSVCAIGCEILQKIKNSQAEDENCQLIKKLLQKGPYEDYMLRNEVLYKFKEGNYLLIVPSSMQKQILRNIHEQGHINAQKVEALSRQEYYIPNVKKKIEVVLSNCVPCILASRKSGKQEGLLNPIEKIDVPLHTYHIDHLGPLASTAKNYKYLFVVIDAFTKFCWIYPTKDTTAEEALKRLDMQSETFGDPHRIISDRGAAFVSNIFRKYCEDRKILQVLITTGVPRGNGQVERLNQTIISVLSKLSVDDPQKWYKHVPHLQRLLNSTTCRATGRTPFELLIGVKMRRPEDFNLRALLEEELQHEFEHSRDVLRQDAKGQIQKIQEENKRYSLRKRKLAPKYQVHDLVAIKRTQFLPGSKLYPKFMGPYEIIKVKKNDRYDVRKLGQHEGPSVTSAAADGMKLWSTMEEESSSEPDEPQDGRMWESNT